MFAKPMGDKRNVKVGLTATEAPVLLNDLRYLLALARAPWVAATHGPEGLGSLDRLDLLERALASVVEPGRGPTPVPSPPAVDAEGTCQACEDMPTGDDGRAPFCAAHRALPRYHDLVAGG